MSLDFPAASRRTMSRLETWTKRHTFAIFLVAGGIYLAIFFYQRATRKIGEVDWLFFVGVATILIGVRLAMGLPNKMSVTFTRLAGQGIFDPTERLESVRRRLDVRAEWTAQVGAVVGIVLLYIANYPYYVFPSYPYSSTEFLQPFVRYFPNIVYYLQHAIQAPSLGSGLFSALRLANALLFLPVLLLIGYLVG